MLPDDCLFRPKLVTKLYVYNADFSFDLRPSSLSCALCVVLMLGVADSDEVSDPVKYGNTEKL